MARIPYRDPESVPDEVARMMDVQLGRNGFVMNVTRAMANAPELLRRTNSLAMYVSFHSSLHPVLREFAILTVGRLTGETYLHQRHLRSALANGVTPEQIAELENWAGAPCFDDYQRAVMRYAWQATERVHVSDAVANAALELLGNEGFLDLVAVVAFYNYMARLTVPLQLEIEEGYAGETRSPGR